MISANTILGVIAVCILAAIARLRFRSLQSYSVQRTSGSQSDWIVALVPTAIAIRVFNDRASLLIITFLAVAVFMRKTTFKFRIQVGPLVLLFVASAIVISRRSDTDFLLTLIFVYALILRVAARVDARAIISSLIDGCGLYLLVNVIAQALGLESPTSTERIGDLVQSTGFVRIAFPLGFSINSPSLVAAVYIVGSIFLLPEVGRRKRVLRLVFLMAAIVVLVSSGSRLPSAIAAILSIVVVGFPSVTRWISQAATLFASISAFILPGIVGSIQSVLAPLAALAPGRATNEGSIVTLENRYYIWDSSIKYWYQWINDFPHILFGYGVNGHYFSGASRSYAGILAGAVKNPEFAQMHNSFLQQIFDGGVIGWLLLVLATFWACTRFVRRRKELGHYAIIAISATAAVVLCSMTEVSLAPGPSEEGAWILLILITVACQATASKRCENNAPADEASESPNACDQAQHL